MEILIRSALEKARGLETPFHIRYSERKNQSSTHGKGVHELGDGPEVETPCGMSYVIIHKDYSYLEPVVRAKFEGAEDIKVVVDRRSSEHVEDTGRPPEARRFVPQRRASVPMLEILINVDD